MAFGSAEVAISNRSETLESLNGHHTVVFTRVKFGVWTRTFLNSLVAKKVARCPACQCAHRITKSNVPSGLLSRWRTSNWGTRGVLKGTQGYSKGTPGAYRPGVGPPADLCRRRRSHFDAPQDYRGRRGRCGARREFQSVAADGSLAGLHSTGVHMFAGS